MMTHDRRREGQERDPCIGPIMLATGPNWGVKSHWVTHEWTLTYLGDEWRWDSEPYGEVVSVGWAWRRELKDAGEELPEAVDSEEGDSGLQSQELHRAVSPCPPPHATNPLTGKWRQQAVDHTGGGQYGGH